MKCTLDHTKVYLDTKHNFYIIIFNEQYTQPHLKIILLLS